MKVLYDSQAFDMQTHGGVSRCFAELYSHLPQDIEASLSVMESANVYLKALGIKPDGENVLNLQFYALKCKFVLNICRNICNVHSDLFHCVTITKGDSVVFKSCKVNCHANWGSNLVLTAISLSN